MAEPFIFINTYRIKPGKKDEYLALTEKVADLIQSHEPRMLYFGIHVAEEGKATTVQVHADAENMEFHMEVIGECLSGSFDLIDWESMDYRIYGTPTEGFMEQLRQLAASGSTVTVSPAAVGFDRFPET